MRQGLYDLLDRKLFSNIPELFKRHDANTQVTEYLRAISEDTEARLQQIDKRAREKGQMYAKFLGVLSPKPTVDEIFQIWQLGCKAAGVEPRVLDNSSQEMAIGHSSCILYQQYSREIASGVMPLYERGVMPCRYSCIPLVEELTDILGKGNLEVRVLREPNLVDEPRNINPEDMCVKCLKIRD